MSATFYFNNSSVYGRSHHLVVKLLPVVYERSGGSRYGMPMQVPRGFVSAFGIYSFRFAGEIPGECIHE
jgi:hypothetical protein